VHGPPSPFHLRRELDALSGHGSLMSSITTAVPSGIVTSDWCIQPLQSWWDDHPSTCANASRGTTDSDFQTICCDGDIVDTKHDILSYSAVNKTYNIDDLVCCGIHGPQQGGFGPPVNIETACGAGSKPTPLVNLAATNRENAALFNVTYTSASYGSTTTGDYVPTATPS
jgi:hypothetical protein